MADISDWKCWSTVLETTKPETIYHLLGTTGAPNETAFDAAHVHPTNALLRAALELGLSAVPIFIVGSAAEYGNVPKRRQPIAETELAQPAGAYGRSKLRATEAALEFSRRGLHTVVVRLFNVFGRGMSTRMMPGSIVAQLRDNFPQIKTGPLERVRDFLRADVAMDALARLGEKDLPGGTILNLCSGHGLILHDIVRAMLEAAGRPNDLVIDRVDSIRSEGVMRSIGSPDRLAKILGFYPSAPSLSDFAQLV